MQYLLIIYSDESYDDPVGLQEITAGHRRLGADLRESGAMVGGNRLTVLTGTPASSSAKQLEHVAAMLVLPFWLIISVTERIIYGNSSSVGRTAVSARSAR